MSNDQVLAKYKELLTHLTTGSRDLISDLTSLSEQNPQISEAIVECIEQRIKKCLPRYKLFGFYLLDSIVKNVGNPYSTLFGRNLYQLFTESYLYVTDTVTRQHMIDLFTTWRKGVSTNGTEIFDKAILDKIEQFIIRATTLSQPKQESKEPSDEQPKREDAKQSTPLPSQITQFQLPSNITPEHFHREFNLLLQYLIKLNTGLTDYEDTQFSKRHLKARNAIVSKINDIDELIMRDSKTEFNMKVNFYHKNVIEIRSFLDQEKVKQDRFISKHAKPIKPNPQYVGLLKNIFEPVEDIDQAYDILDGFGIRVNEEEMFHLNMMKSMQEKRLKDTTSAPPVSTPPEDAKNDNPLGLGFDLDLDL